MHFNSGIPNKAAYLMATGGSFHNITVTAMTAMTAMTGGVNTKLEDIWYLAQTTYLMSSDDFADARQATIDAATALYGAGAEVTTVQTAWVAVGVGVPEVSTVPSVLAFGNVAIGGSKKDLSLVLSNPGDADLTVYSVGTGGAPFTLQNLGAVPFAVFSGGSTTITVQYNPTDNTHGDEAGSLTIAHNDANSPTVVSMTGYGAVQIDATAISAGKPTPGGSETFTVTLTNPSGTAIDITSVVSTSPFFLTDWVNVVNEVGAGGTFAINITYTHSSPGRHTVQLLITHNQRIVVNLAGGAPKTQSVLGFHDGFTTTKTVLGVPFGAEYMTLLLAGIYGLYALRRSPGSS